MCRDSDACVGHFLYTSAHLRKLRDSGCRKIPFLSLNGTVIEINSEFKKTTSVTNQMIPKIMKLCFCNAMATRYAMLPPYDRAATGRLQCNSILERLATRQRAMLQTERKTGLCNRLHEEIVFGNLFL